jgi:hypothetical protein
MQCFDRLSRCDYVLFANQLIFNYVGNFSASVVAFTILVLQYHMLTLLFLGAERVHGVDMFL